MKGGQDKPVCGNNCIGCIRLRPGPSLTRPDAKVSPPLSRKYDTIFHISRVLFVSPAGSGIPDGDVVDGEGRRYFHLALDAGTAAAESACSELRDE